MSQKFKINPNIRLHSFLNPESMSEVADPVSVAPQPPTAGEFSKVLKELNENRLLGMSGRVEDFYALTAYASIYTKVSEKLKGVITAVDQMRNFYLVEVILNQIAEDALSPKIGSDEIVNFSSQNVRIQKELDELKKRIGLDQLIENIAPDLLAYGEYTLATKISSDEEIKAVDQLNQSPGDKPKVIRKVKKGDGIHDVTDIVDQGTVISLTQDGKIEGYLKLNEQTNQIEVKEVADYIKFSLGGQRVRIDIKSIIPKAAWMNPQLRVILDKIPRFIRVGKSVLYPILSKLKELELLEKLVPATKLNKLSQGNLVGMNVPEGYDLEEAMKAVRRIEGMVNKKVSVDPTLREITVESILSTAGKTKIIPLFGDKGGLDKLDYKSDEPDDLTSNAKELRELILDSIGVPSELVFKSDGDNKSELLKRYAKYLRKLKRLQKSITDGCKQIAFIHLANKGIKFKEEDIDVVFNNSLVEIDNLDKLEHADVTLSFLGNVRDFFNDMSEEDSPYREMVDLTKVSEYLEDNLKTVGLADAIMVPKEGGEDPDKSNLDVDGVDSQGQPTNQGPDADAESDGGDEDEFEKENA